MRNVFLAALLCAVGTIGLAAQKGRDLSKLDACKILTPADVSAATKRKAITSVGGQVHCSYVVEAPQSDADTDDFYLTEAAIREARPNQDVRVALAQLAVSRLK